ncbi:MAG: hypothetical protein LKE46_11690 [Clostridium sp.]|uniref:hypothetical protein n=1 Tax=Clostridium sp. TaxID=1506 RepID=UPI0025C64692|nr:hypothetical protein [Clostridium sp.]MCH3964925.1 hypothetical protein [Clostridium sp.]MCI1716581.1 hypothetical protein [Clostridium sp.]MCI1800937.1 hypothetical protein [Clostridium sp.]MCI1814758.1 hypothetical protein [Clostridium sp.]MCI1871684.1 hypothetical protein [Clostridium sp.]
MNIIIKGIILLLFLCWWYGNKKNIKLLLLVIFFTIDFFRIVFLENILTSNFLPVLNAVQLVILLIVFILYIRSAVKNINDKR